MNQKSDLVCNDLHTKLSPAPRVKATNFGKLATVRKTLGLLGLFLTFLYPNEIPLICLSDVTLKKCPKKTCLCLIQPSPETVFNDNFLAQLNVSMKYLSRQ